MVVALAFSTVATTKAVPAVVPAVSVPIAYPLTVVKLAAETVPKVVVNTTVAPVTGVPSVVTTSIRIVAEPWLFTIPTPPYCAVTPIVYPEKLGPTRLSISVVQDKVMITVKIEMNHFLNL